MRYENCRFCICLLEYYIENNELYRHSVIISAGVLACNCCGPDSIPDTGMWQGKNKNSDILSRYARKGFPRFSPVLTKIENMQIENPVIQNNYSATLGKPCDAEQLNSYPRERIFNLQLTAIKDSYIIKKMCNVRSNICHTRMRYFLSVLMLHTKM